MQGGLNERQLAVLEWVGLQCPDGVWSDSTYKVSAQALQSRELVKVTKRRGHWNAQLTDKGRAYLASVDTSPGERNGEVPAASSETLPSLHVRTAPRARTNYTDQLLEELTANNNYLVKAVESGPHAVNWASRVGAARKSGKVPHTQELRGKQTHRGYEIKLVDIPAWRLVELTPLIVPTRLTRPHTVVAALQQQPHRMGLPKSIYGRALRIIQTLVTATESQGHTPALGPTQDAPPPRHRRQAEPHFTITAHGESIDFLVLQEQDHSKHIPTDKERADAKKHTWIRTPASTTPPPTGCVSSSVAAPRTAAANGPTSLTDPWKTKSPKSPKKSTSAAKPPNATVTQTNKPKRRPSRIGKAPRAKPTPHTPTPIASSISKNRQTPGARPSA
ncbi:hypothetical protein [Streptomyces sp. NPDC058308]|uniref:hypothetical protein n=1 Tax=Streptomyces sp. NPDC058308 TaxID=3346440 RepID=UPI0036F0BCF3